MTTTVETGVATPRAARHRWIDVWDPENPMFWEKTGKKVARRNLVFSILAEHIGFSVWTMWASLVLFLGPKYGFTPADKFLLTSTPALVGSLVRVPYTFAVARFGGRNWTVVSALLLVIPLVATLFVLEPGVSLSTLMIVGALGGVGGGNFASSMTNINAFYPDRLKGRALGLNAGAGNLGVAAVQLVALLVLATAGKTHPKLLVGIYLPLVVIAALMAWLAMDNLSHMKNDKRAIRDVMKDKHTWVMSLLYIGTFGSFIGFGFAFGQVLLVQFKSDFPTPLDAAYLTFIGPLIGSFIRPIGGWLADHLGGAKVTLVNFFLMGGAASLVLAASDKHSLPLYLTGFIALFVFSGVGNGSTYKMIPAIFKATREDSHEARRMSGALIGLAGAIGAFGGVLVNVAFRESFLRTGQANAAYIGFIAFYGLCVLVTWAVYLRPGKRLAGV
jgi:NNP family nitrate/nitrite transporter-like MFS transporter